MCACHGTVDSSPLTYCLYACLGQCNNLLPELLALAAHIHCEVHPLGDDVHLGCRCCSNGRRMLAVDTQHDHTDSAATINSLEYV